MSENVFGTDEPCTNPTCFDCGGKKIFLNGTRYESLARMGRKVQVVLEVALDPVPGWGDNIEDHINLMFARDPYVMSATVEEKE